VNVTSDVIILRLTYATRFSHTARRSAGVISSLGGAAGIEGGGGRTSENDREGTLVEPEGVLEAVSDGALNVADAAGRAGLLRELVAGGVFVSFPCERSSELIFNGGSLELLLGGAGSCWLYEWGRSFEDGR
jgi:hypothetical protein